ncbi:hypothetical protein SAMD00024442_4_75 [Candidatus Symbiothrix dinenymphae]|nr:hypothetical protein SAMD00024442_4_75 [Candidatus Symbiothrix dinenymphae]
MKAKRIEKLRNSMPIEITGNEITPSDDLKEYKKNALEYGKSLRGEYINMEGKTVQLNSSSIKEVLHHDYKNVAQLQSIAAIPQIIASGIYIDTIENEEPEKNTKITEYQYFVAGLKIDEIDYTVKSVIAVDNNGYRYYDHKLTQIAKEKLLDELDRITNPSSHQGILNSVVSSGLSSMGDSEETAINSPVSDHKDKRLISILQTNYQKLTNKQL